MPLILEDEGKKLGKRQAKVPDKLVDKIKANLNLFGNYSQSKGYKRANSIVNKDYNKHSNKKDKIHNDDKTLSFSDIKKIDHEFKDMSINDSDANVNNLSYILPGGNDMKNWAHDTLRKMRTAVKKVDAVPQVPKLQNNPAKVQTPDKDIKMGSASVRLTESEDWLPYYDAITYYDAGAVLYDFIHKKTDKQQWEPLIQPDMYKKALSEFVKYGRFVHFPTKYVYQWMGIIMNNTAKLRANTELVGHLDCAPFPLYELKAAIEEYPNFFSKAIKEFGEVNEDNCYYFMESIGLYDWMNMPDGSDAWSDYGLPALERVISNYKENMSPEETIVIINKALDCAHPRGDLSSIFIVGGSKTLTAISESIKRNNKKIIVNESQLLSLKEYHDQTVFNFDNNGEAYFKKNNWENYVDFLESMGKYGTLPPSTWDKHDISNAIESAKGEIDPSSEDINEDDYIEAFYDLVCHTFIYEPEFKEEYFEDYFLELFNDYEEFKENNNYFDECQTIREFLDEKIDIKDTNAIDYYLTSFGNEAYEKEVKGIFLDKSFDNDFEGGLQINDRGLIYMERNITIPNFNSPNFKFCNYRDYYKYLNDMFTNIGNSFSWDEGRGESYCGNYFGEGTTEIKLKCWVDPKDVNWETTVYRNCYSLRDEMEIYIDRSGAKVEVFAAIIEHGKANGIDVSGKSLIKNPIIITY